MLGRQDRKKVGPRRRCWISVINPEVSHSPRCGFGCKIAVSELRALLDACPVELRNRVFRGAADRKLGWNEAIALISPDVGGVDAAHDLASGGVFLYSHGDKPADINPTADSGVNGNAGLAGL